jgi:riboflavin synthase alpha subunit
VLHLRQPGDRMNIEVDQIAKQVERILHRMQQAPR